MREESRQLDSGVESQLPSLKNQIDITDFASRLQHIPQELTQLPQWVNWVYKDKGGPKPTKIPVNSRTGEFAKCNDPATWSPHQTALQALDYLKERQLQGLGFVLTDSDPYIGIDLDNCINPESGEIAPWAKEIVSIVSSYTEISPSGKGLRIIVRGKLPPGRRKNGQVEAYEKERYLTLTGNHLPGATETIETRNGELEVFYSRFLQEQNQASSNLKDSWDIPSDLSRHDEILKMIVRWKNAAIPKNEALLLALRLAEKNNKPGARILTEAEMRKEVDYIYRNQSTNQQAFAIPSHWRRLDVAKLHEWNCKPIRVIVENIIAASTFIFVAAQSQVGKTLFGLYLALQIIIGGSLFGKYKVSPVQKALYFVLEDPDRRIEARLKDYELQLPDEDRFIIEYAPGLAISDPEMFVHFRKVITEEKPDVVFIDTYQKATPGISSFNDEEQSLILHKLSNLTRELDVTIVVLDHIRKSDNNKKRTSISLDDIKGTGGKVQNADCIILMERSGDDQIKFHVSSKDFDQRIAILLSVSRQGSGEPKFTYAGELTGEAGQKKGLATQKKVYEATGMDWISSKELQNATGLTAATILRHLTALVTEGKIENQGENKFARYRRINQSGDDA